MRGITRVDTARRSFGRVLRFISGQYFIGRYIFMSDFCRTSSGGLKHMRYISYTAARSIGRAKSISPAFRKRLGKHSAKLTEHTLHVVRATYI